MIVREKEERDSERVWEAEFQRETARQRGNGGNRVSERNIATAREGQREATYQTRKR